MSFMHFKNKNKIKLKCKRNKMALRDNHIMHMSRASLNDRRHHRKTYFILIIALLHFHVTSKLLLCLQFSKLYNI